MPPASRRLHDGWVLLAALVRRDLTLRYKHTVLGVAWALFAPLMHLVIFAVVFTRIAPVETGVPYPLFAAAGLLPWTLFASAVRFGATSLTTNATLVTKTACRRDVFPLSAVLVALVDFSVAFVVFAIASAWAGVRPGWGLLAAPLVLGAIVAFSAGVSLLVAMAHLWYRDVKYLLEALLMAWLFASPVAYPTPRHGTPIGDWLAINPLTPLIDAWRATVLEGRLPDARFAAAALVAALTLVIGWVAFRRAEHLFAERI